MITTNNTTLNYLFRYIIVGDMVGKSCIMLQFVNQNFRSQHNLTIGVEFGSKTIEIEKKFIKIQVWDTAGQEAFHAITRSYFKGALCALLVYDITRRETFEHITRWICEVKQNSCKSIVIVLIGNKKDLEEKRQVSTKEGEALAKENDFLFYETSAKTSLHIEQAFLDSSRLILEKIEEKNTILNENYKGINLEGKEKIVKKKRKCC